MTERLFETNPYIREFEARVLKCTEKDGRYFTELDRTAFFPEGGGQPGDRGFVGEAVVKDTHETDGCILHETDRPLKEGQKVCGILDWHFRYSNMQNHGGEHIVSGLIHQKYGYDNVGFHMGSEEITIDINGELTWEQVMAVEEEANRAVLENVPIQTTIPTAEALRTLDYRSKKALEGDVRIVEIPGYDRCACCDTHVLRAGEIHLIKILWMQNYKGGVRIGMLSGIRALKDYGNKHDNVTKISHLLSAKTGEIYDAVERLQKENADLKYQMIQIKKEMLAMKAAAFPVTGEAVCAVEGDMKGNELRDYANLLAKRAKRVLVLSGGDGSWRYVLTDAEKKAKDFGIEMQTLYQGKGGGSPLMVQGTLSGDAEEIRSWFENHL